MLLAASYRWPIYAPAFSEALEHIGIEVIQFDFNKYLYSFKTAPIELRLGFGPNLIRLNRLLRKAVRTELPDICMIWTGLGVWPSTIRDISQSCWVTSYTNDDPFGHRGKKLFWRLFRKGLKHYNSHHVYRDINYSEYASLGFEKIGIMKSYYVPWLHYPENITKEPNFENRISFIGYGEPFRIKILSLLAKAGIKITVYGPQSSWRGMPNDPNIRYYPGTIPPDKYREVVWNSPIMLGFLSKENRDNYTRRYFEIPACGGFLLAERTDYAKELFVEDKEMVFFSTPEEAVDKCRHYLANSKRRDEIVNNCIKRCNNSKYDIYSCAQKWIEDTIAYKEQN